MVCNEFTLTLAREFTNLANSREPSIASNKFLECNLILRDFNLCTVLSETRLRYIISIPLLNISLLLKFPKRNLQYLQSGLNQRSKISCDVHFMSLWQKLKDYHSGHGQFIIVHQPNFSADGLWCCTLKTTGCILILIKQTSFQLFAVLIKVKRHVRHFSNVEKSTDLPVILL